ncbi:RhoGAP-domain-containing protein [Basidiobolus meristosporus CBS 931.73]|uniref:RhoGAP-domain-containing protein n=1 Tax=Basidiobolus meristosporus CBS 931.73 TaxID=1314790 RepID=A0A1Y1YCV8_9FUNG|nr:RhoGAP-domain-containing protein [Basidiobolus meristosporus CBS 931.73]|eukprot:ORX95818.1 RhoGAP-domain-containing protein [Basidiobolus meristosporus CBS 931.73]
MPTHSALRSPDSNEDLDLVMASVEHSYQYVKDMTEGNQLELASLLNFFRNRLIIEEQYWKSLDKLAKRQAELFPLMTGGTNLMTTCQQAFRAIVYAHEDLATLHRSIAEKLAKEIVERLAIIKDNHRSKGSHIKSVLKSANKEYLEYRTQTLPKLQKTYISKCESLKNSFGNDEENSSRPNQTPRHKQTNSKNFAKYTKAKKELDDADEDYRRGIQQLERVRQKHAFHTKNAFEDSKDLESERIEETKEIFQKYSSAEQEMCNGTNLVLDQIYPYVECIKPEVDIRLFSASRQPHDCTLPQPVYYNNYYVGVTKDLIFGVPLTEHHRLKKRHVPLIVEKCIDFIDNHGLNREGIYRVSGKHSQVQQLRQAFEKNEEISLEDDTSVASVASLLKTYIRELPEPLFPFPFAERVEYSKYPDAEDRLIILRQKLSALPDAHLYTLLNLARHLARVAQHSDANKMNISNVSLIFTPVIFHDAPDSTGAGSLAEWQYDIVLEDLVNNIDGISDSDGLLKTEGLSSGDRSSQLSSPTSPCRHSRSLSVEGYLMPLAERNYSTNTLGSGSPDDSLFPDPSMDTLSITTRGSLSSFDLHSSQDHQMYLSRNGDSESPRVTIPDVNSGGVIPTSSNHMPPSLLPPMPPRPNGAPASSMSSQRPWNLSSPREEERSTECVVEPAPESKWPSLTIPAPSRARSISPHGFLKNLIS